MPHTQVTADPCEYTDLADQMPELVKQLADRLKDYSVTAVPPVVNQGCECVKLNVPGLDVPAWAPCDHP